MNCNIHFGDKLYCIIDYQEQLFVFPCTVLQIKIRGRGAKCTVKVDTGGGAERYFDVFDGDIFKRRETAENERKRRERYA